MIKRHDFDRVWLCFYSLEKVDKSIVSTSQNQSGNNDLKAMILLPFLRISFITNDLHMRLIDQSHIVSLCPVDTLGQYNL